MLIYLTLCSNRNKGVKQIICTLFVVLLLLLLAFSKAAAAIKLLMGHSSGRPILYAVAQASAHMYMCYECLCVYVYVCMCIVGHLATSSD